MPSVIKLKIMEMFEKQNADQAEYYFNLMYSVYSFPNVLLPIISGLLIDRIGIYIHFYSNHNKISQAMEFPWYSFVHLSVLETALYSSGQSWKT